MKLLAATAAAPNSIQLRRGVYRKHAARASALALPAAWEIGNKKSFAAARARAMRGILGDLELSGREKAVLGVCIDHMNANKRWSCFASIKTIARESGASAAACWCAIGKADGKHILTKRASRGSGSQYVSTHITLHPNCIANLRPSSEPQTENKIAELKKLDRKSEKTRSQNCEQNPLQLTHFKEPIEVSVRDLEGRTREGRATSIFDANRSVERIQSFGERRQQTPWPKHGQRSEKNASIFIHFGTADWDAYAADFEASRGVRPQPASKYGGKGRWFKINGEGSS